jgi:Domain of unknown function (DUF6431)
MMSSSQVMWSGSSARANVMASLTVHPGPQSRARPISSPRTFLSRGPQSGSTDLLRWSCPRKSALDWITIRRGICRPCKKTITFLPVFSLPYSHYSLIARSEALRRYFVEGCSWEAAAPPVKDPHRVADSSTLRRWFRALDSSRPPFSFLTHSGTS